jgi:hypothetical protein
MVRPVTYEEFAVPEPLLLATAPDGSARYRYRDVEFRFERRRFGYRCPEVPIPGTFIAHIGGFWVSGPGALNRLLRKVRRQIDRDYAEMRRDAALAPGAAEAVASRFASEPDGDWQALERDLDRAVRAEGY